MVLLNLEQRPAGHADAELELADLALVAAAPVGQHHRVQHDAPGQLDTPDLAPQDDVLGRAQRD